MSSRVSCAVSSGLLLCDEAWRGGDCTWNGLTAREGFNCSRDRGYFWSSTSDHGLQSFVSSRAVVHVGYKSTLGD